MSENMQHCCNLWNVFGEFAIIFVLILFGVSSKSFFCLSVSSLSVVWCSIYVCSYKWFRFLIGNWYRLSAYCAVSSSDIESHWPYKVRIISANPFLQFKTFDLILSRKRQDVVKHGITTFVNHAPTHLALLPLIWCK